MKLSQLIALLKEEQELQESIEYLISTKQKDKAIEAQAVLNNLHDIDITKENDYEVIH